MRVRDIEFHLLQDCTIWGDGGGLFGIVPRVLWEKEAAPDQWNRVEIAVRCLLVIAGGKRILVDAGYGDKVTPRLRDLMGLQRDKTAVERMAELGLQPADIDIVVNTHLHADHAAGNTTMRNGRLEPTFSKAEYWVREQEWHDAIHANERTRATYLPENLLPLQESGQLRLLPADEPEIEVAPGVRCVLTPGHTPGHQSVVLGEDEVWFLADVAPYAVQLERTAWVPAYDLEPIRSMETKRHLVCKALEKDPLILFQHDPQRPMGRLKGSPARPKLAITPTEAMT